MGVIRNLLQGAIGQYSAVGNGAVRKISRPRVQVNYGVR